MEIARRKLRTAHSNILWVAKVLKVAVSRVIFDIKTAAAILVGLIGCVPSVFAATYYINSEIGNDSWSGKLAAAAGSPSTDGPWQTLSRLATAPLLPGDIVYLACGSLWNETLRISSSGTSDAPIVVSAGPNHCEAPPTVDGAVAIPSHMWQQHNGAIYRARLPIEYISNPGLSENLDDWRVWSPANDASISLDTHCNGSPLPCMEFASGTGSGNSVVVSNSFPLAGGVDYAASARIRAPAGTRLKLVVRRNGPTFESLATDQYHTATGGWQTIGFTFRATRSAPNARFDIELPSGRIKIGVRDVHMQRVSPPTDVIGVFVDGAAVRSAHHPNFGGSDVNPDSPYGNIASDGGKTALDTAGLTLPPDGNLMPGLNASVRTWTFALEERKVASVSGSRLTLDQATSYLIKRGYGYFLTGALWMLDSPGEWHFDSSTGDLYVWMPDGAAPGNRVSFNSLTVGVNLQSKAHLQLVGLKIRRVGTGVQLRATNNVRLKHVNLAELSDYGIQADNSRACTVEQSSITNTGLDAVSAVGWDTTGFTISDSRVIDSGALARKDGWRKLPRPARAAIDVGPNARISHNEVRGSANNGIFAGTNSSIEKNYVESACLRYNDCGGIYANYAGNDSSIVGNVVKTVEGHLVGLPEEWPTQAVGIYLDDGGTGIEVRKNTVTNAEYGLQIHNSNNSKVSENLFFGNRRYQIWMQEKTAKLRANGDIFGHQIESNVLVPISGGPSVFMESEIGDTGDFATFSGNHYSGLLSPRPIGEKWVNGSASYALDEWLARGQDADARVTQPIGYASFLTRGENIVPNSGFANNFAGWTWWNQNAPYARAALLNCDFGPCLQITAGASASLLASPNFSINGEQWYRVSFDAATSQPGQPINVLVRRGGGGSTNYEPLMPAAESFSGSTQWRRYSFVFRASKTVIADNPLTGGELGARVDFERIPPGSSLTVAHLEVVPLAPSQAALQLRLQLNSSGDHAIVPCAAEDETSNLCDKFIDVKDNRTVDWAAVVEARSGNALYTLDTSLLDTDSDGIADIQDACPTTPKGSSVNARGCEIDE